MPLCKSKGGRSCFFGKFYIANVLFSIEILFDSQVFLSSLESGNFPDSGLPVAEILVLAGFLMIYMLEEALHLLLVKCGPLKDDEKSGGEHLLDFVTWSPVQATGTAMGTLPCQPRTESWRPLEDSLSSSLSPSTTSLRESHLVWQGQFL